jgi:hypothetical protein
MGLHEGTDLYCSVAAIYRGRLAAAGTLAGSADILSAMSAVSARKRFSEAHAGRMPALPAKLAAYECKSERFEKNNI